MNLENQDLRDRQDPPEMMAVQGRTVAMDNRVRRDPQARVQNQGQLDQQVHQDPR